MIGAFILIALLFVVSIPLLNMLKGRHPWLNTKLMYGLYWYHVLFAAIYFITVMSAPSDSVSYYRRALYGYYSWFDSYATSTVFIHFVAYPFVNFLGFTYEMMMVLFAWMGYWGFVYFYIFFKENIRYKHVWLGIDLTTLIVFLPNMHFWSASLGKGAIIFFGIGLAVYGLSRLDKRKFAFIMGLLIVYHVRPHIFFIMAVAVVIGLFTGRQKIPLYQKFLVLAGGVTVLIVLYDQILAFANLDSGDLLGSYDATTSKRASDLAKSGSGIDISSYPFILKLFTFWYRPLFFDSPSIAGIMVSFENLFYIMLTLKLFDKKALGFIPKSPAIVKTSLVVFLGTSLAMCGTLSNLGLIIRQKTMVMYFFIFVILALMDYKKGLKLGKMQNKLKNKQSTPIPIVSTTT